LLLFREFLNLIIWKVAGKRLYQLLL